MSFRIQNGQVDLTNSEPGLQSALDPPSVTLRPVRRPNSRAIGGAVDASCSSDAPYAQDGYSPDDGADAGDRVERAVALANRQDGRRYGRRNGKGKRAGDVEHAEIGWRPPTSNHSQLAISRDTGRWTRRK